MSDTFEYTVLTSDTVEVRRYLGFAERVEISESFEGYKVTSIGVASFSRNQKIQEVVIPETIVSIGQDAFSYCENLKKMIIPASVQSLGNYAFAGCKGLQTIQISKDVVRFGIDIFEDASDTLVIQVEKGSEAMRYCRANRIEYVLIDDTVSGTDELMANDLSPISVSFLSGEEGCKYRDSRNNTLSVRFGISNQSDKTVKECDLCLWAEYASGNTPGASTEETYTVALSIQPGKSGYTKYITLENRSQIERIVCGITRVVYSDGTVEAISSEEMEENLWFYHD